MNKEITVITVCYNAVKNIERTIMSVLNQTAYPQIDYIIVDGGSTDGTLEVINRYKDQIHKIVSEPDKGIYDAMNKGVNLAEGEYVNFMNAGDIFSSDDAVEKLIKCASDITSDIIFGDEVKCYTWGKVLQVGRYFHESPIGMKFGHQSTFVRTSALKKYPFDISFKILADSDSMAKLYQAGYSFYHAEFTIAEYDMYGASNHPLLIFKENARIMKWGGWHMQWHMRNAS